ncbi:MAG TPA: divalent-cation tolerance protein CutA [Chlamydiales bacterium]|nr:divalent-cation tolerance protein CutA [Chlamydiales bacterium]
MTKYSYLFWTSANLDEAKKIAHLLLSKKLIGCASIIPHVISLFEWKGKIEEANEVKVILKTKKEHYSAIRSCIEENASYEVPEIILIEWDAANQPYLDWISETTK